MKKKKQMILEDAYENSQITYIDNHCLSVTKARVNGLVEGGRATCFTMCFFAPYKEAHVSTQVL